MLAPVKSKHNASIAGASAGVPRSTLLLTVDKVGAGRMPDLAQHRWITSESTSSHELRIQVNVLLVVSVCLKGVRAQRVDVVVKGSKKG